MANTRVTTAAENPLCARLKDRFDGRGAAVAANDAAVQTGTFQRVRKESATVKKVKSVANPFEETARFERSQPRTKNKATAETIRFTKVKADSSENAAKRRVAAYETVTPFASGAYSAAYTRAAAIRARAYDGSEARASAERSAKRAEAQKGPKPFTRAWFTKIVLGREDDEIVVKKKPISPSLIIGIVIFAIVVMMIVFSFAQISEFKKEISSLEDRKAVLCEEIDQLELDIDLKNDIRTIEQIATEDIGMVKSNRVESKYISVAKGDRIEVPEGAEEETPDYGVFTTMMSAANSNWDRLMEYID